MEGSETEVEIGRASLNPRTLPSGPENDHGDHTLFSEVGCSYSFMMPYAQTLPEPRIADILKLFQSGVSSCLGCLEPPGSGYGTACV